MAMMVFKPWDRCSSMYGKVGTTVLVASRWQQVPVPYQQVLVPAGTG
jgi:hypothetical protein